MNYDIKVDTTDQYMFYS